MIKFAILFAVLFPLAFSSNLYDFYPELTISRSNFYYTEINKNDALTNYEVNKPIRITPVFNQCSNIKSTKFGKSILPDMLKKFSKMLLVKNRNRDPIIYELPCLGEYNITTYQGKQVKVCDKGCYEIDLLDDIKTACFTFDKNLKIQVKFNKAKSVLDTDLALVIHDVSCGHPKALARGAAVQLSKPDDRPNVGIIQLCSNNMDLNWNKTELENIFQHELMHVLAFSPQLFPYYRNDKGHPLSPRDNNGDVIDRTDESYPPNNNRNRFSGKHPAKASLETFSQHMKPYLTPAGVRTKMVPFLKTFHLRKEAESYYKCPGIYGIPLEDDLSLGTYAAHFEKRIFQNELCTGTISKSPSFSRFSLALLKDSGWYIPDMQFADHFDFGKNLGCDFIFQNCYEYIKNKRSKGESTYPYCDSCLVANPLNHNVLDQCSLFYRDPAKHVDAEYLFADDKSLLYNDRLANYCPLFYNVSDVRYKNKDGLCETSGLQQNRSIDLPNALWTKRSCKDSKKIDKEEIKPLQFKCDAKYGLMIYFDNRFVQCRNDLQLDLSHIKDNVLIEGKFNCPDCGILCSNCPSSIKNYSSCSVEDAYCKFTSKKILACIKTTTNFPWSYLWYLMPFLR